MSETKMVPVAEALKELLHVFTDMPAARNYNELVAKCRRALASAPAGRHQDAPLPLTPVAWIVTTSKTISYPHIERLVDVGQFPSGTKLYALDDMALAALAGREGK